MRNDPRSEDPRRTADRRSDRLVLQQHVIRVEDVEDVELALKPRLPHLEPLGEAHVDLIDALGEVGAWRNQ